MTSVSVVVPMHATRASLPELLDRLGRAGPGAQVVLVDDACPEGSGGAARALGDLPGGLHGMLVDVRPGVGQQSAVLIGLAWATDAHVAVALLTVVALHLVLGTFEILYLKRTDALG